MDTAPFWFALAVFIVATVMSQVLTPAPMPKDAPRPPLPDVNGLRLEPVTRIVPGVLGLACKKVIVGYRYHWPDGQVTDTPIPPRPQGGGVVPPIYGATYKGFGSVVSLRPGEDLSFVHAGEFVMHSSGRALRINSPTRCPYCMTRKAHAEDRCQSCGASE